MCRMFILLIFIFLHIVQSETQTDNGCSDQMENYRQCVKTGLSSFKTLTKDERRQFKNDISNCFLNEKCQNPFPSDDYLNVTRRCYYVVRNESRREIQTCVRRDVSNFVLPQDESRGIEQMQLGTALLIAARNSTTCPTFADKNRLVSCVVNKASAIQGISNKNVDVCQLKDKCINDLSSECKTVWNEKVIPSLCKCISNVMVERYKQEYSNCVRDKGVTLLNNDPTQGLVESSIKAWCQSNDGDSSCQQTEKSSTTTTASTTAIFVAKPHSLPHGENGEETTLETSSTISTSSSTSTATSSTTTITPIPNQNFFVAMANSPLVQKLVGNSPGLKTMTDLFLGKTDLSAIFPSVNLLSDFQLGLTNMFGNKLP